MGYTAKQFIANKENNPNVKEIDGFVISLNSGDKLNQLERSEPKVFDMVEIAKKKLSFNESWISDIAPAALKITDKQGNSIIAVGHKENFDQKDLKVSVIKGPSGKIYELEKPIIVSFDTENNDKDNKVLGAISKDGYAKLKDALVKFLDTNDYKEMFGKDKTRAAVIEEKKYEVASVDTNSRPLNTPAGNPALMKAGREGIA